ncbi:MAG: DUF4386 family protein [Actinomycetota bacterium]
MLNWSDSRNFGRTLAALSLFITPLLLLASGLLAPDLGDNTAEEIANIADDKGLYVVSGILFLLAPLLFVPGMMGVIHLMRRRGVTLGQVGAAMIMIGALCTLAFYGWGAVEYVAATEDGLDRAQMAKLFDAAEDSAIGAPIIVGFLGGLVIGSILLAIALWRSGVVPVWSPIALVLSNVINFIGEDKVVAAIGFALLFVALLPVGQKILSIRDDEWDSWQLPDSGGPAPAPAEPPPAPPP